MRFLSSTCLLAGAISVSTPAVQAAEIVVEAYGLEPAGHTLYLAVFNDAGQFDAEDSRKGVIVDQNFKNVVVKATAPAMRFSFEVPDGTYAIKAFYDVDGDQKLGANFLGIPTEPYGFSNNARGTFAPPGFDKAVFDLSGQKTLRIDLY